MGLSHFRLDNAMGMNAVWHKPLSSSQASDFFQYYCLPPLTKQRKPRQPATIKK
ncbi:MAG: hypothetical protein GY820_13395 [Gammaproteobacteria bacterium]|nr:hypothetical protein [Gammaproteobacteria bacterium]